MSSEGAGAGGVVGGGGGREGVLWSRAALAAPVSAFFTPSHQRPLDGPGNHVGIGTYSERGYMLGEAVKQKGQKDAAAQKEKPETGDQTMRIIGPTADEPQEIRNLHEKRLPCDPLEKDAAAHCAAAQKDEPGQKKAAALKQKRETYDQAKRIVGPRVDEPQEIRNLTKGNLKTKVENHTDHQKGNSSENNLLDINIREGKRGCSDLQEGGGGGLARRSQDARTNQQTKTSTYQRSIWPVVHKPRVRDCARACA